MAGCACKPCELVKTKLSQQCDLPWMNAMTFLLDQYFYLHIKPRLFFPSAATEQAEKVPYQARMCVKDSFVKCWQQPHKPLPSRSSPPTRPGGRQEIPQYGLVLALYRSLRGRWLYGPWCQWLRAAMPIPRSPQSCLECLKLRSVALSTHLLKTCLTIVQVTLWMAHREHLPCCHCLSN